MKALAEVDLERLAVVDPDDAWVDDGRVILQVTDTGVGIAPRDRENILMPFWTKRSDGTRGRGLGLSIVQHVVQAHGGTVSVESRPGEGSTFSIYLPIQADGATSVLVRNVGVCHPCDRHTAPRIVAQAIGWRATCPHAPLPATR